MRKTLGFAALAFVLFSFTRSSYAGVRDVAIAIDRYGGIIVDARVDGQGPFRLLIDTGSSRSVLSQSICDKLGAQAVARTQVVSAGSSDKALIVRLHSLSIGVAAAQDLLAIVTPSRHLRELGGDIDGIVGQDFLGRFNYMIDQERKVLTWNPTSAERPEGGMKLRLVVAEGRFLVELPQRHDDGNPLLMVPDSGADTIVIFQRASGVRVPFVPRATQAGLAGLSGVRDARAVTVASLRIGDASLNRRPAVVVADDVSAGSDGLLPLKLFRRLLFDAQNHVLTLWM